MADAFTNSQASYRSHAAVTTHNTNPLAKVAKAIFVGVGGNIALRAEGASADVTLKNIPSGAILPIRVKYVRTTNTTATDIVALY